MLTVSRRGLLALGGTGAAGVVLSACGAVADQREDASQEELLTAEIDAELALAGAYRQAGAAFGSGEEGATFDDFAAAAEKRAAELRSFASDSSSGSGGPPPDGGPDAPEALSAAANLANDAIAAHRQGAGLLDQVDTRALASASLVACAAELAAVNHFAGNPEAPEAFVTGGEAEPHEAAESTTSSTTTSSTTSTTSTTESQ